jgi:hypothetical protein
VVPNVGWFDTDYLGIDQGPILAMLENHRSGLVWRVMRRNEFLVQGLRRAGFTGGWLDEARNEYVGRVPRSQNQRGPAGRRMPGPPGC